MKSERCPTMRIALSDANGTYAVERPCGETLPDMLESLVVPVFMAAGFDRNVVYRCMQDMVQ